MTYNDSRRIETRARVRKIPPRRGADTTSLKRGRPVAFLEGGDARGSSWVGYRSLYSDTGGLL